jgi:outer membrane protein OmpA-like peptidoglycan-associated protein
MINYKKTYALLVGAVLLLTGLGRGLASAADCGALHEAIRQERVLVNKRTLVEAALKSCPNDPDIYYQNGYILERLRKYADAMASYRKAIALEPGYAKAYFSLADILALQNDYGEAVAAYREGLRHDPGDERAKGSLDAVLAKYQEDSGQKDLAVPVSPAVPAVSAVPAVPAVPVIEAQKTAPPKAVAVTSDFAVAPIVRLEIPFSQKTAALSRDAQDVLSVVVGQAMKRENMRSNKFEIGGHTDNQGDANKNYEISKERAEAVKDFLVEGFSIEPGRLKLAYHGPKKPKAPNDSPANQELNRRVDFTRLD